MSEKLYRDKIAAIKKQQGAEETALGKARAAAAKHHSDAAKERAKVTPRTRDSTARSYQRAAEAAEEGHHRRRQGVEAFQEAGTAS